MLNENTWEVEFTVHNVHPLLNGHVIASKVDTRATAEVAFTPYVQSFNSSELWMNDNCSLTGINTPDASLGIATTRYANCTRSYTIVFSLVNSGRQNSHCTLVTTANDLAVGCSLTLSSTRAYDLTEPTAFLSAETSFTANITLPRNLNNEVSNLLYATLAKCNVLNFPDYVVDCRMPGLWYFQTAFTVSENIDWIDENSCVQSRTADATFIRCGLNSVPVGLYTEAVANISAVETNRGETMRFSIEYTLPRSASAIASASLQNFIISIGMVDEKYYYAGADRATLYIETFATSRLAITQLDMFNANGQVYSLRDYPQFQLSESSNATHFIIAFRPSAIRQDSAFYRNGPHGVNVSFLFTAASNRRQMAVSTANSDGYVTVENIHVRGDASSAAASNGDANTAAVGSSAASSSVIVIAAAVAATVLVAIGSIVAVVVVRNRRTAAQPEKDLDGVTTAKDVPEDQV